MTTRKANPADISAYQQLVSGVVLPIRALQRTHKIVISNGLRAAWGNIPATDKATASEVQLNNMMAIQLNRFLEDEVRPLSQLVAGVSPGRETMSFDATSIQLKPDISLTLRQEPFAHRFPLAIECKLIDHGREARKSITLYCGQGGLGCFVDGRYAWERQEAYMLAYVRDVSTIDADLTTHLAKLQKLNPDPCATNELPDVTTLARMDEADSMHGRDFPYLPPCDARPPGQIQVRHLWLYVEPPTS